MPHEAHLCPLGIDLGVSRVLHLRLCILTTLTITTAVHLFPYECNQAMKTNPTPFTIPTNSTLTNRVPPSIQPIPSGTRKIPSRSGNDAVRPALRSRNTHCRNRKLACLLGSAW